MGRALIYFLCPYEQLKKLTFCFGQTLIDGL